MAESWTNRRAVLRDLASAQGRLPRCQNLTLTGDRPKYTTEEEETEEQFYSYLGSTPHNDVDFSQGADVGCITEMISLIRSATEVDDGSRPADINPYDYRPQSSQPSSTSVPKESLVKKKTSRNVAIQSLIQSGLSSTSSSTSVNSPVKRPNGNKRTGLLSPLLPISANRTTATKDAKPTPPKVGSKKYVPSARAQAIYEKLQRVDEIREMFHESVWIPVTIQLDEIDERRRIEAQLALDAQQAHLALGYDFPVSICLPQERHTLLLSKNCADCVVCKSLCETPDVLTSQIIPLRKKIIQETSSEDKEIQEIPIENGISVANEVDVDKSRDEKHEHFIENTPNINDNFISQDGHTAKTNINNIPILEENKYNKGKETEHAVDRNLNKNYSNFKNKDANNDRRRTEAQLALDAQQAHLSLGYDFPLSICLPQERHTLLQSKNCADCVVCKSLCEIPGAQTSQMIPLRNKLVLETSSEDKEIHEVPVENGISVQREIDIDNQSFVSIMLKEEFPVENEISAEIKSDVDSQSDISIILEDDDIVDEKHGNNLNINSNFISNESDSVKTDLNNIPSLEEKKYINTGKETESAVACNLNNNYSNFKNYVNCARIQNSVNDKQITVKDKFNSGKYKQNSGKNEEEIYKDKHIIDKKNSGENEEKDDRNKHSTATKVKLNNGINQENKDKDAQNIGKDEENNDKNKQIPIINKQDSSMNEVKQDKDHITKKKHRAQDQSSSSNQNNNQCADVESNMKPRSAFLKLVAFLQQSIVENQGTVSKS